MITTVALVCLQACRLEPPSAPPLNALVSVAAVSALVCSCPPGCADCCAICCCEYEAGQPVIKLSCSHIFHKECIHAWLKVDAVCPICKTNLRPQAPPCQCPHAQHIPPLAAPAPAATAPTAPAAAPGTVEAVGALSQAAGATLQMGVRSAGSAAAITASAARCTPASPRALSPAWQQHSLGSPVLGAAGVSP